MQSYFPEGNHDHFGFTCMFERKTHVYWPLNSSLLGNFSSQCLTWIKSESLVPLHTTTSIGTNFTLPVPRMWRQTIWLVMMFMLYNTTATAIEKMRNRIFSMFLSPALKCTENFIVKNFVLNESFNFKK